MFARLFSVVVLLGTSYGFAKPLSVDVSAPTAILIQADTGKVLFAKHAQTPCYPSSTTKIATALYALHRLREEDYDKKITVSKEAVAVASQTERRSKHPSYRLEMGGTHIGLRVGETLSIRTLLYGLMLASGNDAANVIAEVVSGSVPLFLEEMDQFLKGLGCQNTRFRNPHGLPDREHQTTAYDLAIMARQAMTHPFFRQIVGTKSYEREETNKQPASMFQQHNALLKPGKYFYPYATGIKTGYTVWGGYALVASAQKKDRNLIAVVTGCDELSKRYRSAVQLFEAAFQEEKQARKLLCREHDRFYKEIEGAKEQLDARLAQDVIYSFYPSEEEECHPDLEFFSLSLPVQEGEEVGCVRLLGEGGKVLDVVPLVAACSLHPTMSYRIKELGKRGLGYVERQRVPVGYTIALLFLVGGGVYGMRRRLQGR